MVARVDPLRKELHLLKLKDLVCRKDVGSKFTTFGLKTAEGHFRCSVCLNQKQNQLLTFSSHEKLAPSLSSFIIPIITGWISHLLSRLPPFYPPLRFLITCQSFIAAHKLQAAHGNLRCPSCRSVPVLRGTTAVVMSQRSPGFGGWGANWNDGNRDFRGGVGRRWLLDPPTHNSELSKDNQLRYKCSLQGGQTEGSPVSLAPEHKVCLW